MNRIRDKMCKTKKLKMAGYYPCSWDDLIDEKRKVYTTIHTLKSVKKDSLLKLNKECITFDKKENVYDIVIDVPELTEKVIKDALRELSRTYAIKRCFSDYLKIINFRKIWTERGATE